MSKYYKGCCRCKEDKCSCEKKYEKKCCCKCEKNYCCCEENKKLIEEAFDYSEKARIAIIAIFEYKDICENKDVIDYFYEKAEEAVKCLYEVLEKLAYYFNGECFYCKYEAAYVIQRALRNTEIVAYVWKKIPSICEICECECKYCEAVGLVRVALERIEDVVREVETLFKLFKEEC